MGRPPKKKNTYKIVFHDTTDWYDDLTKLTTGVSFIWKITSPDAPANSKFYYVADLHLPPKTGKHVKNATAVWVSGEGIIMADTKEGAEWWKRDLEAKVGIDARDPLKRKTQSTLSPYTSYDVYFTNEDKKELVRDVSARTEEDFIADFEEDIQKLIKVDKIHNWIGFSAEEIYSMIPLDKILESFEKLSSILDLLTNSEKEEEEETPEEEEDEFGGPEEEPSEEELAGIEAEEAEAAKKRRR